MIKKATIATFNDGDYAGDYDWTGGIPLSVGEVITIVTNGHELIYVLVTKQTTLIDDGKDQEVVTTYSFDSKSK